jgi:hypothetical protein
MRKKNTTRKARLYHFPAKRSRQKAGDDGRLHTTSIAADCHDFEFIGLPPGSLVESVETRDIKPGELICFHVRGGHAASEDLYLARFVSLTDELLTFEFENGEQDCIEVAEVETLARVTRYTHTVTLRRSDPATDAAPADSPVVDLTLWRSSRPPKLRKLLFAEKA